MKVFITLLILALPLQASEPAYLAPATYTAAEILPAPPVVGTPEGEAEAAEYARIQREASPEELAAAQAAEDGDVFSFSVVLGENFTAERLPKAAAFFAKVTADTKAVTKVAKEHFKRIRPEAKELAQRDGYAYPSGHTTRAFVWAQILSVIYPEQNAALIQHAELVGKQRIILGRHYPADVAAGKVYATYLAKQFLASPTLQADLETVKAELTANDVTK